MTDATDATDIRNWAKEHGKPIGERGRIPGELRAEYEAAQTPPADDSFVPIPDVPQDTGETPPATPPPAGKKRRIWDRKPREPRPPGRLPKRITLESWAARAWKGLAYISGAGTTPTSRCLNMQAPVAGIVLDDMIKGTAMDLFLQPIARLGEGAKDVGALVGLPLLVAITERRPSLYPVTRGWMASAAEDWVLIAGPAMRKAKARAQAVADELAGFELDEDDLEGMFASAAENPVIGRMLDAIFAPMMNAPAGPEKETAAA